MNKNIAIIDLGSSSFHLLIVQVDKRQCIKTLARHKFKAQLRLGVDAAGNLTEAVQQQALQYLAEFAGQLQAYAVDHVKAVGTYTLRSIKNSKAFLQQAHDVLGFPIEIISGDEEARLVYVGATAKRISQKQTLVIDIGGGSTELVVGKGREILLSTSLDMGCVSMLQHFFTSGKLTAKVFEQATAAAADVLEPVKEIFVQRGWQACVGYSGTLQMISNIMQAGGLSKGSIDLKGLEWIQDKLITFKHLDEIVLPGLRADRANLLPGGLAILLALFKELNIAKLTLSQGGVREGLLFEVLSKIGPSA